MFVDTTLLRMGLFEGSNISFIDAEYVICIRYPDCWWLLVESDVGIFIESFKNALLEVKLPYEPSCPFFCASTDSVGLSLFPRRAFMRLSEQLLKFV